MQRDLGCCRSLDAHIAPVRPPWMRFVIWSRINHFYTFGFHAYQLTKRRTQDPPFFGGASWATPCVLVIEDEANGRASVGLRCGTASRELARRRPYSWEAL